MWQAYKHDPVVIIHKRLITGDPVGGYDYKLAILFPCKRQRGDILLLENKLLTISIY